MAVYKPTYTDKVTGELRQQAVWWYNFSFVGRRIQESSHSQRKTIAVRAEKIRRAELERTFNGVEDKRKERIRPLAEVADAYLNGYRLRHKAITFAEHAIRHVKAVLGTMLTADVSSATTRVTTALLGRARVPGFPYENTDGSPLVIDHDYYGKRRRETGSTAGPFEDLGQGELKLKVWTGRTGAGER